MKRKRIIVVGSLKRYWDKGPFEVNTESGTIAEAIKAFSLQCKALRGTPGRARPRIRVVGHDRVDDLFVPTEQTEIKLVMDMAGGKSGGFVQILLGAALIAASFIPGLNAALWAGAATFFFSLGASLVLGGLMAVLSPAPKRDSGQFDKNPASSKYLGAPKNTVESGTRIPICYGEVQVYGHYVHFDIDAVNVPA